MTTAKFTTPETDTDDLEAEARARRFIDAEDYAKTIAYLKMIGVSNIRVHFAGYGDSGNIETIIADKTDGTRVELSEHKLSVNLPRECWSSTESRYIKKDEKSDVSLEALFSSLCEDWLEETGLDWYNNEGGQGEMTVDMTQSPPSFNLRVGINFTTTDDHFFEVE